MRVYTSRRECSKYVVLIITIINTVILKGFYLHCGKRRRGDGNPFELKIVIKPFSVETTTTQKCGQFTQIRSDKNL